MTSRKLLLVFTILILLAALVIRRVTDSEPRYNGRSLTSWLIEYRKATYAIAFTNSPADVIKEPRRALRAIGTNAMPFFMALLRKEPRHSLLAIVPQAVRESEIYDDFAARWDTHERRWLVSWGFEALGPQAASAFPQLLSMIQGTNEDSAVLATLCAGCLGTNADAAIPFLAQAASGGGQRLPVVAIMTLGTLGRNPDLAVPALEQCLRSTSTGKRALAARSLGKFGFAAKHSVPALVELLGDTNTIVRTNAINALLAISPEAITNGLSQQ